MNNDIKIIKGYNMEHAKFSPVVSTYRSFTKDKKVTIKNITILIYLSEYKFGKNKYVILNRFHESSQKKQNFRIRYYGRKCSRTCRLLGDRHTVTRRHNSRWADSADNSCPKRENLRVTRKKVSFGNLLLSRPA